MGKKKARGAALVLCENDSGILLVLLLNVNFEIFTDRKEF